MPATPVPPAQPTYILRGHSAAVHQTAFIRGNTRLVTGDAEGWIVVWDVVSKRAVAVWKAHEGIVVGVGEWVAGGEKRLITQGKDSFLSVWRFAESDEDHPRSEKIDGAAGLLVAVPSILTSETVDVFQFPTSKHLYTVPKDPDIKSGMIMALSILRHPNSKELTVIVGYESGLTMVSQLVREEWKVTYLSRCHEQPILSLDVDPVSKGWYLTSSADAIIGKHPIPDHNSLSGNPTRLRNEIPVSAEGSKSSSRHSPSLLSSIFTSSTDAEEKRRVSAPEMEKQTMPIKVSQTKHSGQQSLRIRSDGKIFATAGWDSKVRVYSTKTVREIAVLKWHGAGCFAVDFARVSIDDEAEGEGDSCRIEEGGAEDSVAMAPQIRDVTWGIKRERLTKVRTSHWVAVGSKDGKVSLWVIC